MIGIVEGYQDSSFKPEKNINRAEFLKIAIKSKDFFSLITGQSFSIESCGNNKPFSDVPNNEWYCEYVKTAKEYGFISRDKSNFNPSHNVTLAQALKILLLIHGKNSFSIDPKINTIYDGELNEVKTFNENEKERVAYFSEKPREGWYFTYVNWAREKNLSFFENRDINYDEIPIKRVRTSFKTYREIERHIRLVMLRYNIDGQSMIILF